ncbi:hypothetical protein FHR72_004294 [Mycolicibacterium iranicum]|uniref:Glyoxalase-like domain-containing protein n=1 Tax=Mycolicibacterium iranicum TaxID=912594 RepID=A0A839QA00_MYCIR|nr:VOC family protein [Mycolicibacterium iranicum]MBB2992790.1 hypothetical protein [Mycolicibacterium iranicum]
MTDNVAVVVVESRDPLRLGLYWATLLGCCLPTGAKTSGGEVVQIGGGAVLEFVPASVSKAEKNRQHLDLTSKSEEHQASLVERACALGAERVDIGQGSVPWIVLADPEGNEFCVLEPREEYKECGPVAAVVTDARDPLSVSRFWSSAVNAPLVRTHPGYVSLRHQGGLGLEFVRNPSPPQRQGQLHLRLRASHDPPAGMSGAVSCSICTQSLTALVDPENNHFCLSGP